MSNVCNAFLEGCERSGRTIHPDGTVTHIFPDDETMARQRLENARVTMRDDIRTRVLLSEEALENLADYLVEERGWRPGFMYKARHT